MEMKKQQLNFWLNQNNSAILNPIFSVKTFIVAIVVVLLTFVQQDTFVAYASVNSSRIYQLQQRLISNPRDQNALLDLAMEYSLDNDFVKAVNTYFALLKISPRNFHAYNNLGILYKKSGQFRDSLHCYKQAAKINPDSYWVPYNMGLCYEAMGRMEQARESYGTALSLNPGFTQALQRLRNLSGDTNAKIPALPALPPSGVLVANGQSSQPRFYSPNTQSIKVKKKPVVAVKKKKSHSETTKIAKIVKKITTKSKKVIKYRTKRKGATASLFNQAMDAMDDNNIETAIDLYTRCVIADKNFLAEPDNGLIKKALIYLKDRPNRMKNGLFYRGFFISISASLDLAIADIKSYLAQQKSSGKKVEPIFKNEALNLIDRYNALVAEREELAKKAKQQKEEQIAAKAAEKVMETPSVNKPGSFVVKQMNADQIITEADKLSRATQPKDAISVLQIGLEKYPDNLKILMKIANAYTDMLLLKGDKNAGKMALIKFQQVYEKAPPQSTEWAVAKDMIAELKGRLK